MGTGKVVTSITVAILLITGFFVYSFREKQKAQQPSVYANLQIEKTWKLPNILNEISGIALIGKNEIACIQDEDGTIFIYDLEQEKIVEEIEFAGNGDYEGIAISGNTAYVLESNGSIFEIENFKSESHITEYKTSLSAKEDVEGLALDKENNRLLLAIKEKDPNSDNYKGIYAFNLNEHQLLEEPVYKINYDDSIFKEIEQAGPNTFKPSEIVINPANGDIVLIEGTNPKLLILTKNGEPKEFSSLKREDFPQPEGLAFDSGGTLYISNEGNPGTIHRILLN